jgi:hypothetical protein
VRSEGVCQRGRRRYLICVGPSPTAGEPFIRVPQRRAYAEFSVPLLPADRGPGSDDGLAPGKPGGMWGSIVAVLANVKLYTGKAGKKGRVHPGIDLILGELNRLGRDL